MAVVVSLSNSSSIPSLKPEFEYSASASASASSTTKLSSLSSSVRFRFASGFHGVRIRTRTRPGELSLSSRPRHLPLVVSAKKETYSSFDDLLAKADKPVLVDFYATWCGPCQFMVPILNEVSVALKDKIQVVKIDTEKYPSIADKYRIEALPTFVLFKDGKPYDRFEGALTANQLIQRIEESLKVKQ